MLGVAVDAELVTQLGVDLSHRANDGAPERGGHQWKVAQPALLNQIEERIGLDHAAPRPARARPTESGDALRVSDLEARPLQRSGAGAGRASHVRIVSTRLRLTRKRDRSVPGG